MTKTSGTPKDAADGLVRGIKRRTRQYYSAEEKITIVWRGRAGEKSIAGPRRREGIAESLCYSRSMEFLEAGNEADYRRHRSPDHGAGSDGVARRALYAEGK